MSGRFYIPDDRICLIFDTANYSELRKRPEFAKNDELEGQLMYRDLPEASEWAQEFQTGIADYGFAPEQIHRYTNPNARTFYRVIQRELVNKIKANVKEGKRTLVVSFYAGHGAQNQTKGTSVLCNTAGKSNMEHYELEQQLIQNVVKAGAYLIGLFACSRMPWP